MIEFIRFILSYLLSLCSIVRTKDLRARILGEFIASPKRIKKLISLALLAHPMNFCGQFLGNSVGKLYLENHNYMLRKLKDIIKHNK